MKHRPRSKRAAVVMALTLVATLAAVTGTSTPAGADPAPIPSPSTAVGTGGSIIIGTDVPEEDQFQLPIPHPARPAECQDGEDNESGERISGGNAVDAADGLIDYDEDPQCAQPEDNSELASTNSGFQFQGVQPKQSFQMTATRDPGTGELTVDPGDVVFPVGYLGAADTSLVTAWWILEAGLLLTGVTGNVDDQGNATLTLTGRVTARYARQSCSGIGCILAPNNGGCDGGTAQNRDIPFTSGSTANLEGKPYDDHDKLLVGVAEGFEVGSLGSGTLCSAADDQLGLPNDATAAAVALSFEDTAGCAETAYPQPYPASYQMAADCWEPRVEADAPETGEVNEQITLTGDGSYDPGLTNEVNPEELATFTWTQIGGDPVTVNQDGKNATFTATEEGTYSFRLTAEDNPYYDEVFDDVQVIISGAEPEEGSIAGVVSDGEDPVADARVTLYPAEGQGRLDTTVTNSEGEYEFTDLDPDNYKLRVLSPGNSFVTQWWDGATSWLTADEVEVLAGVVSDADFTVEPAGIVQGRVVGRYYEGHLSGVNVRLYNASGGLVGTATTGANGWFSFPTLAPGDYLVRVASPGYQTQWYDQAWLHTSAETLELGAGQNIILSSDAKFGSPYNTVWMTPTDNGQFQGTVTDADTEDPIAGAAVRIYTADGFQHQVFTDSNGDYSLAGAAQGTVYYIRVSAPGYERQWWNQAGPVFDDCAGSGDPECVPTEIFANPIVWPGGPVGHTGVNAALTAEVGSL